MIRAKKENKSSGKTSSQNSKERQNTLTEVLNSLKSSVTVSLHN